MIIGIIGLLLILFALSKMSRAQSLDASALSRPTAKKAIENLIKGRAEALMKLTKTKNLSEVLRFYSEDYKAVEDGHPLNLEAIRERLAKVLQAQEAGNKVEITVIPKTVSVRIDGDMAYGDYKATVSLRVNGSLVQDSTQDIGDTFRWESEGWKLVHSEIHVVEKEQERPDISSSSNKTETQQQWTEHKATPATSGWVVNESFNVDAGGFRNFNLTFDKPAWVSGRFDVGGSRFSDIRVFLVSLAEYDNLRNNRAFRYWYVSGQVKSGTIHVRVPAGQHVLVFGNAHSVITGASVRATISWQIAY